MKSVFGTAQTPFGICGFGYIDDNDLLQYLQENKATDKDGLKDCKIYDSPVPSAEITKEQALQKVRHEMQNNQQLRFFLSRLPLDQQRNIVRDMLDTIMGLYK